MAYGNKKITVVNTYGSSSWNVERVAIPTVTSIAPNLVSEAGGTGFVIAGTNFVYPAVNVVIKMGTASLAPGFTVTSQNSIANIAITSSDPGTYPITVINKTIASGSLSGAITSVPIPVIASITGTANDITGGKIYISGTKFLTTPGYTVITLSSSNGIITASPSGTWSTASITATLPAAAPGLYTVIVTNRGVTTATSASGFEYTQAFPPIITSISTGTIAASGDIVTISGSYFQFGWLGVNEVITLDTSSLTVLGSGSAGGANGWYQVQVPYHAPGIGNFRVANAFGTSSVTSSVVSIEFMRIPTITSRQTYASAYPLLANGHIASNASAELAITGTNFLTSAPTSTFRVNNVVYAPHTLTTTNANITLPAGLSNGTYDIVVSNRGVRYASATLAGGVIVETPGVANISSVSPTYAIQGETNKIFQVIATGLQGNETAYVTGVQFPIYARDPTVPPTYLQFQVANVGTYGVRDVSLSNSAGTSSTTGSYAVVTQPTITSVTVLGIPGFVGAGNVPTQTGAAIAVTGTNFSAPSAVTVTVGGASYAVSNLTNTSFTVTIPAGVGLGNKVLLVSNPTASAVNATNSTLTVVSAQTPSISSIVPTWAQAGSSIQLTAYSNYLIGNENVLVDGSSVGVTVNTRGANYIAFTVANIGTRGSRSITFTNAYGTGSAASVEAVDAPATLTKSKAFGATDSYASSFTISGGPFYTNAGGTVVSFPGASGFSYVVNSTSLITVNYTGGTEGDQTVTVTNKGTGGAATLSNTTSFKFIKTPHLSNITSGSALLYANVNAGKLSQTVTLVGTAWSGAATTFFTGTGVTQWPNSTVTLPGKLSAGTYYWTARTTVGGNYVESPETMAMVVYNATAPSVTMNYTQSEAARLAVNGAGSLTTSPTITATAQNGVPPFTWARNTVTPYAWTSINESSTTSQYNMTVTDSSNPTFNQDYTHTGVYSYTATDATDTSATSAQATFNVRWQGEACIIPVIYSLASSWSGGSDPVTTGGTIRAPSGGYTTTIVVKSDPNPANGGFYTGGNTTVSLTNATNFSYVVNNADTITITCTGGTAGNQTLTVTNKGYISRTATVEFVQTPSIVSIGSNPAALYGNVNTAKLAQSVGVTGSGVGTYPRYVNTTTGAEYGDATIALPNKLAAGTYRFKIRNYFDNTYAAGRFAESTNYVDIVLSTPPALSISWDNGSTAYVERLQTNGAGSITTPNRTATVSGLPPYGGWTRTPASGYDTWTKNASTTSTTYQLSVTDSQNPTFNQTIDNSGAYYVSNSDATDATANSSNVSFRAYWTGVARAVPTVTNISPDYGASGGYTNNFTITGTNFYTDGNTTLAAPGLSGFSYTVVSTTSITCSCTGGAVGNQAITITNTGQPTTTTINYEIVQTPTISSIGTVPATLYGNVNTAKLAQSVGVTGSDGNAFVRYVNTTQGTEYTTSTISLPNKLGTGTYRWKIRNYRNGNYTQYVDSTGYVDVVLNAPPANTVSLNATNSSVTRYEANGAATITTSPTITATAAGLQPITWTRDYQSGFNGWSAFNTSTGANTYNMTVSDNQSLTYNQSITHIGSYKFTATDATDSAVQSSQATFQALWTGVTMPTIEITSLSTDYAGTDGSGAIYIYGSGFTGASVSFGYASGLSYSVQSDTEIYVTWTGGSGGTTAATITVSNPVSSSSRTFYWIATPHISYVEAATIYANVNPNKLTQTITLTITNFNSFYMDGSSCSLASGGSNNWYLTFPGYMSAGYKYFRAYNTQYGRTVASPENPAFEVVSAPALTGISPSQGSVAASYDAPAAGSYTLTTQAITVSPVGGLAPFTYTWSTSGMSGVTNQNDAYASSNSVYLSKALTSTWTTGQNGSVWGTWLITDATDNSVISGVYTMALTLNPPPVYPFSATVTTHAVSGQAYTRWQNSELGTSGNYPAQNIFAGPVTANASGGTGAPKTFIWWRASGDTSIYPNAQNSATTSFYSYFGAGVTATRVASFHCQVTDSGNGAILDAGEVTVTIVGATEYI